MLGIKYDLWGSILGHATRRKLEQEVKAGSGPVLAAVLPILTPIINQQVNKAAGAIEGALGQTAGTIAVDALEAKLGGGTPQ